MGSSLEHIPWLRRPAIVNAAEYWLRPDALAARCRRLGDRFCLPMPGTGPWLCLTHPEDIGRVFTADTDTLRLGAAVKRLAPHELILGPTGLTTSDGADHLRKRRMQLGPLSGKALQRYEHKIERIAEDAVSGWPLGRPQRAIDHMQKVTLDVILVVVFGVGDPGRLERLRAATLTLVNEAASTRFLVQTALATSQKAGWERPVPRIERAVAAVDAIIVEEIRSRQDTAERETGDVLSLFLAARDAHGNAMSESEICDAMRTLLIGGHETTASTLAWTLERVARHPAVIDRLEAAAHDGDDGYIDAVIKEAMRLRSVFPMTARLAHEPFELNGLTVPAGTMIVPYITLVHTRADLYPEPFEFRPERFLHERAGTYSWIPFGGGPRRCIGAGLAQLEARIVLRTICRRTHLTPADTPGERIGRKNVTIVPARGATITLQPRTPAAAAA